jgi:predicted RNase H-like HicB family nuclease
MILDQTQSDYTVVFLKAGNGWSAYLPDLPGCTAIGRTLPAVTRGIQWAIRAHIRGMKEDKTRVPRPRPLQVLIREERLRGELAIVSKSRDGYVVIAEKTRTGYSAYAPDLSCFTTGHWTRRSG